MIAVDTSALMGILLDETQGDVCITALETEPDVLISAGTASEALLVACRRDIGDEVDQLIVGLNFRIVPVTLAVARRIAQIHAQWGRGAHPAQLNFGDCFAYDVAKEHDCPLLFTGDDFSKTDLKSAL